MRIELGNSFEKICGGKGSSGKTTTDANGSRDLKFKTVLAIEKYPLPDGRFDSPEIFSDGIPKCFQAFFARHYGNRQARTVIPKSTH
jgi:hypothetical protein